MEIQQILFINKWSFINYWELRCKSEINSCNGPSSLHMKGMDRFGVAEWSEILHPHKWDSIADCKFGSENIYLNINLNLF